MSEDSLPEDITPTPLRLDTPAKIEQMYKHYRGLRDQLKSYCEQNPDDAAGKAVLNLLNVLVPDLAALRDTSPDSRGRVSRL